MPIDVNNYNAQFSQFVQFAERQMQAGKAKAFASLGAEGATGLAARDIKPGSGDSVHDWIRYKDSKIANDAVRELFRQSVAAMFDGDVGGEEMLGINMLAGGLVAARLGQDALRSIKGALESPVAGQLQAIYTDLSNEDLVEAGVPKHEATIMKRTVSELSSDILSLLDNVNATLGAEGGNVPAFKGSLDDLDGFDDIAIEIRDMTNKVHADLIQMEREENEAREAQRKAGANGMQGGNLVIEP